MLKPSVAVMIIGIVLGSLSGCAGTRNQVSLLDENWGRSYESAAYLQTANPHAGENVMAVTGMNGRVAATIVDEYGKSFTSDQDRETINILKLR